MADDGATPRELLLEACRRNNTTLLTDLLSNPPLSSSPAATATFLNTTTDALGASALHLAAQHGSYDVLDQILDQEGVEIDGQEKRDGDTALHRAARWCNGLDAREWDTDGKAVVDILVDAGCDPRIRNRAKLRPFDLLDPRNAVCRDVLRNAEMTMMAGDDVVDEDEPADGGEGSESD